MKNTLAGLLFAMLWASASVATKIGLQSAQPLAIANTRFFLGGAIMLLFGHLVRRYRLPSANEWLPLLIYGLLNVTIYLGAFVFAIKEVSAGIGSLSLATNPLTIAILSSVWLKRPIRPNEWIGLLLGLVGIGIAVYPLLLQSYASVRGIFILLFSMLSYCIGTVYYSRQNWQLPIVVINGWQILLGGICLLPFTFLMTNFSSNHYDLRFWATVAWLVLPVSVGAVQLWLYLLKTDTVKASLWLYICPIFGFLYAKCLLNEPITLYTLVGTVFVIGGLYIGQRKNINS